MTIPRCLSSIFEEGDNVWIGVSSDEKERELEVAERSMLRFSKEDRNKIEHIRDIKSGQVWTEGQTVKAEMVRLYETSE